MITVYQTFIMNHSHDGTASRIRGLKSAETPDGYHANYKDDNAFQIGELDLTVARIYSYGSKQVKHKELGDFGNLRVLY